MDMVAWCNRAPLSRAVGYRDSMTQSDAATTAQRKRQTLYERRWDGVDQTQVVMVDGKGGSRGNWEELEGEKENRENK